MEGSWLIKVRRPCLSFSVLALRVCARVRGVGRMSCPVGRLPNEIPLKDVIASAKGRPC